MRIAVLHKGSDFWSAGGVFTETVVRSLRQAAGTGVDIVVLSNQSVAGWQDLATVVELPNTQRFPGETTLRQVLRLKGVAESYCDAHGISALLLAGDFQAKRVRYKRIPWIPDFQHKHLPQYFAPAEISHLERRLQHWARHAEAVVLSSASAREDYNRFLPHAAKTVVARFPSLFVYTPPSPDLSITPAAYGLPEKFVLVANQFWAHKNHQVIVDAVAILARKGITVPVACTGLPADYRDPSNQAVSSLLQAIASNGLSGQVVPLGLVPRAHLIDLLRCASLVVQPSRFEGWSTIVQDALALGRPVICSDIAVHREQAPNALGFFDCDDPARLAQILEVAWPALRPGPDPAREAIGLAVQQPLAVEHGRILLRLCSE